MNECALAEPPAARRLGELLTAGVERLKDAGIDNARLDGEVILAHALAISRERLLVSLDAVVSDRAVARFERCLSRRLEREPVAYITGRQEFWSLDFTVTRGVLIPRPETERLVEVALSMAGALGSARPLRILDLGTGSGAIAVSLAKELPSARIVATDLSAAALATARANAGSNGVAERITFKSGDMFAALVGAEPRFDLMVANPPYVRRGKIAGLEPEVSRWEPRAALDGGADGLDFYRIIAAQAWSYLTPGAGVALEIGADMAEATIRLFIDAGRYRSVRLFQDYAGRDRVVAATKLS